MEDTSLGLELARKDTSSYRISYSSEPIRFTSQAVYTLDKQENQLVLPKIVIFSTKMEMRYGLYAKEKRLSSPSGFENDTEIAVTEGLQEGKTIKPLVD